MSRVREGRIIRVTRAPRDPSRGILTAAGRAYPCALGAAGIRPLKREGDGATPLGTWHIAGVLYRADRVRRPLTGLPVGPIRPRDGWCDAADDRNYNRRVTLPYAASAEALWRADHVYDLLAVIDYNAVPRARGRGSAIFLHLARPGFGPTEGCLALREADLRAVLARATPATRVTMEI